jgi:hypothetical protein
VIPRDLAVVLGLEEQLGPAAVLVTRLPVPVLEHDGRHVGAHHVVHVADHVAVVGEADSGREEALRHAERVVDLIRVAPLGHDVSAVDDEPRLRRAHSEGPDGLAEGLTAERHLVVERQVPRRVRLSGDRDVDRLLDPGGVEPELGGGASLPVGVGAREIRLTRAGCRRSEGEEEKEAEKRAWGANVHGSLQPMVGRLRWKGTGRLAVPPRAPLPPGPLLCCG